MDEPAIKTGKKREWVLTQDGFSRFLSWLENGRNSDGRAYVEIREKLVTYFDRKNCLSPDDLADETLNRVARRLEEEGSITTETPAKYCYTVARVVFLEHLRSSETKNVPIDESHALRVNDSYYRQEERATKEKTLDCLEKCCNELEPSNRNIIIRYYYGTERAKIDNRRVLADSLGITMNALSIRACRIRGQLEICVKKCVA